MPFAPNYVSDCPELISLPRIGDQIAGVNQVSAAPAVGVVDGVPCPKHLQNGSGLITDQRKPAL